MKRFRGDSGSEEASNQLDIVEGATNVVSGILLFNRCFELLLCARLLVIGFLYVSCVLHMVVCLISGFFWFANVMKLIRQKQPVFRRFEQMFELVCLSFC